MIKFKLFSFIVLLVFTFVLGLGTSSLFFLFHEETSSPNVCLNANCSSNKFFSDEITLYAKDIDEKPFLLRFDLNRQQESGRFLHYYYVDQYIDGQFDSKYFSFPGDNENITAQEFFTDFEYKVAEDQSTQESYAFSFRLNGKDFSIVADNFHGDFITKNSIDYTKYVSLGKAKVTMNGKTFDTYAVLSKIYAADSSKYIFFEGRNDLKSRTHYLLLWDENGDFYLIDSTKTEHENFNYKSHQWVLYKNVSENFMQKAFSAEVDMEMNDGVPSNWSVSIPDLDQTQIYLQPSLHFKDTAFEGFAQGYLERSGQKIDVHGIFKYALYNF